MGMVLTHECSRGLVKHEKQCHYYWWSFLAIHSQEVTVGVSCEYSGRKLKVRGMPFLRIAFESVIYLPHLSYTVCLLDRWRIGLLYCSMPWHWLFLVIVIPASIFHKQRHSMPVIHSRTDRWLLMIGRLTNRRRTFLEPELACPPNSPCQCVDLLRHRSPHQFSFPPIIGKKGEYERQSEAELISLQYVVLISMAWFVWKSHDS